MFPIFAGNSASTGYNLTRSLRFRASATAYLNRTFATSVGAKTWTWSGWVKRGSLSQQGLIAAGNGSTEGSGLVFGSANTLDFYDYISSSFTTRVLTTQVFRDPSAWYHIVCLYDTTQATASNRVKLYVNGVQITSFSTATYPALNSTGYMNANTYATSIGREDGFGNYLDGYLAEVNFIDGQAITPSSFGSTNALTGVWQPARYTGTYGTNGFYLPFTDNSALTTSSNVGLGKDFSGNANYWVTNNISITAGVTYDSMTDVPTLTDASTANYAVINPLVVSSGNTLSNGNLTYVGSSAGNRTVTLNGSFKQYGELTIGSGTQSVFGLATPTADLTQNAGLSTNGLYGIYDNGASFFAYSNGTTIASIGAQTSAGVVFQLAYDAVGGKLWIGRNNVWFNSSLGTTGDPSAGTNPTLSGLAANLFMFVGTGNFSANSYHYNFGQRPFTYTPPTGYVALNTYNLPTSTIIKGNTVMDATLWAGDNTARSITNAAAFKPDLVWIKDRTTSGIWNVLFDSVRGVGNQLSSNQTDAELASASNVAGKVSAFNSNGFSVATGSSSYYSVNQTAENYVGWQWQAGQGSSSSNTNGTITSTVSVNASAGFSVVTYTGTGANATVGHGLGVAPSMVIAKNRSSGADAWCIYHVGLTSAAFFIKLNSTDAQASGVGVWNSTAPTSSVFSVGSSSGANGSTNAMVAYCWTPIAGFSAFGSYTGNGSTDGPFVYTGFRPRWVLIKSSSAGSQWILHDTARDTYNTTSATLFPNLSNAEAANNSFDMLSNGFKIRTGAGDSTNDSSATYIYMAYAENPFKNALAR